MSDHIIVTTAAALILTASPHRLELVRLPENNETRCGRSVQRERKPVAPWLSTLKLCLLPRVQSMYIGRSNGSKMCGLRTVSLRISLEVRRNSGYTAIHVVQPYRLLALRLLYKEPKGVTRLNSLNIPNHRLRTRYLIHHYVMHGWSGERAFTGRTCSALFTV